MYSIFRIDKNIKIKDLDENTTAVSIPQIYVDVQ